MNDPKRISRRGLLAGGGGLAAAAADQQPRLGYASAVAVFFGLAVLVLTLVQAWGVRKVTSARRDLDGARR
jgi:hypothetical protein